MIKLSIIIPVYNVEKYLRNCIDSILLQNGFGIIFEVIVINDGSPDNCERILEEYQKEFPKLVVLYQNNQGLSVARNNGLKKAKGEYVWFIDSDDSIVKNCLNNITDRLVNDIDILQLNYQLTYEDGRPPCPMKNNGEFEGIMTGKEVLIKGGLPAPAQFSIYRRAFLLENNIKFMPHLLHEDSEFKPRATYLAKKIIWHKPIVYNYLQRQSGSIMNSFRLKNVEDIIKGIRSLNDFNKSMIVESECKVAIRRLIGLNMNTLLYGLRQLDSISFSKSIQILKCNKFIFIEMLKSHKFKYILEAFAFLSNINWGLKIHSLFR